MALFSIKVIKTCPVSLASKGVITFLPEHIGMIAGAVRDSIEWMVLLNGSRSTDGFEVTVERITVPQQYRGGAHAEMTEQDLADDVVGVMHSHHHMGAFFSSTDTNSLNPRFPSSVVVAIANNNLGFSYEAEGKVILPCGAVGRVGFQLGVRGTSKRFMPEVVRATEERKPLGDCEDFTATDTEYERLVATACGIERTVDRPLVFGKEGDGLLQVVESMTLKRVITQPIYTGSYSTGSYTGDKLTKKQKRKMRNGLVKLDTPETASSFEQLAGRNQQVNAGDLKVGDKVTFKGGCDDCEARGEMLRWHEEFSSWLCRDCYKWAELTLVQAAADAEADNGNGWSRVTDEIDDTERVVKLISDGKGSFTAKEM